MIGAPGVELRAMLLLGIDCGFGVSASGRLSLSALDLVALPHEPLQQHRIADLPLRRGGRTL